MPKLFKCLLSQNWATPLANKLFLNLNRKTWNLLLWNCQFVWDFVALPNHSLETEESPGSFEHFRTISIVLLQFCFSWSSLSYDLNGYELYLKYMPFSVFFSGYKPKEKSQEKELQKLGRGKRFYYIYIIIVLYGHMINRLIFTCYVDVL